MPPTGNVSYIGFRSVIHRDTPVVVKRLDEGAPKYLAPEKAPDGYEWGRECCFDRRLRELATALLDDVLGESEAGSLGGLFEVFVVAEMPHDGWRITSEAIEAWAKSLDGAGPLDPPRPMEVIPLAVEPSRAWMYYLPAENMPRGWIKEK